MWTIFQYQYSERARNMFRDVDPEVHAHAWWIFDGSTALDKYDLIGMREVPYFVKFMSSYRGEASYEITGEDGITRRVNILGKLQPWEAGVWNYTEEEFERIHNGRLRMAYLLGGELMPRDMFEVLKMVLPDIRRGYLDYSADPLVWVYVGDDYEYTDEPEKFDYCLTCGNKLEKLGDWFCSYDCLMQRHIGDDNK